MKFYSIRLYNRKAEYCGSTAMALMDDESIAGYCDPFDKVHEISKEDFMSNPAFYQQFSDRAKQAWKRGR